MAMASAKLNALSSQWVAHSSFSPRRGSSPRRVSLPIRASSFQHELVQTAVSTNSLCYLLLYLLPFLYSLDFHPFSALKVLTLLFLGTPFVHSYFSAFGRVCLSVDLH